jgi:hypothetical protein
MSNPQQFQQLLDAKDHIIEQQEEKITLLEELAETRRLNLMAQTRELAEHRQFEHYSRKDRWGFFWWLLLQNVWPFSIWYGRLK